MRSVPCHIITAAQDSDVEAVTCIVKHFEGYIAVKSLCKYIDEQGTAHSYVDEDLQYHAEIALYAAIFGFKLKEPPESFYDFTK